MTREEQVPLILGGHSFIRQLGVEATPLAAEQRSIVAACLDHGIRGFDTTYQPERVALGNALASLGRREAAIVIAWNFFTDFGPEGEVGGAAYCRPHHLSLMLEQLQTERLDALVVHPLGQEREDRRQEELAQRWQAEGRVRWLGLWAPELPTLERYRDDNPYRFMVRPFNVADRASAEVFAAGKEFGWEIVACSPFVRGWELERRLTKAAEAEATPPDALRARLADAMLRYALFESGADFLIVAMRRAEWVARNVASCRAGPLSEGERAWLEGLG
jgi:aryl-alcohol dehydrogenase-like predicted oxidoreductase